MHARFAMLGAAGVLAPELLSKAGLGGPVAQTAWYDAGKYEFSFAATVRPQKRFVNPLYMFRPPRANVLRYDVTAASGNYSFTFQK